VDDAAADAAIAYAIRKGWLIGDGEPPHVFASRMTAASRRLLREEPRDRRTASRV
jgi:hypothetical protein